MAVSRPQPWSLTGLATSIPSAWRAVTVGGDVVAQQIQCGSAARLGRVDGELGRRQGEDQPAAARVHRAGAEHLGQGGPGRVGVVAVEDGVGAVDHGFLQTETCLVLSLVNGSRFQPLQRSRSVIPASRAIRSSSDGHT
jgi:hypothetical protein